MKTKCLPAPPERSHECVHSSGHQYYISTLVPSPEMFCFDSCIIITAMEIRSAGRLEERG